MKIKHHYVWKHYLKPWAQNGQIWCNRKGKVFLSSLENIGQKRFFYETYALNETEIAFLDHFIKTQTDPSAHATLLNTFGIFLDIAYGNEEKRRTGLEDYHSFIESLAIDILDKIYENDFSFLTNEQLKNNFFYFIGVQYMRTRNQFNNILKSFEKMSLVEEYKPFTVNMNSVSISKAMALISADFIGNWLSQAKEIRFIKTSGNKKLITGDQPVINLSADTKPDPDPPTEMNIYYPLSPDMAFFASDNSLADIILDNEKTNYLNDRIKDFSNEQLYSRSSEDIE